MVKHIFLVHGYSVRDFNSYGQYARLLSERLKLDATEIYVSAFDSLNNQVTCDDLARSLEVRIARWESADNLVGESAFLCHSTGSIIARRWMLNRIKAGKPIPSHFISLAGANHGSTLAQLGETQLVQFGRSVFQGSSVGLNILSDLDYGSSFLLNLNEEWAEAKKAGLISTKVFSLIGDKFDSNAPLLPLSVPVFWQIKEKGSDGTVRISGSNLNYKIVRTDRSVVTPEINVSEIQDVPHLILAGYSHTGTNGILERARTSTDTAFEHVVEALAISDDKGYQQLQQSWEASNQQWISNNATTDLVSSTVVFDISVPGEYVIGIMY